MTKRAHIDFYDVVLKPDPSRTVVRPFEPGYPRGFDQGRTRTEETIELIVGLDDDELQRQLAGVTASLDENHRDVDQTLQRRFDELANRIPSAPDLSPEQQRLIGASFSQEYAYEAAALFNPSAVPHPDQSGLADGALRFVLALRGVGEGHVSSVTFRTGEWTPRGNLTIDNPGATSVPPVIVQGGTSGAVHLDCGGSRSISETVLFPVLPSQRQGIEDMRLVRFVDDDGSAIYHGTYTAFSGAEARSELLTTRDFKSFEMRAITGDVASAKGMALFPRRIDGRYVTLGRQDNKNIWLNVSSDLLHWDSGSKLIEPRYPWEFVQMGNCGSPIEVDEGWLVLTHGVGTVRNYCIGACLLDKADPSKLLARTPRPCSHPVPTSGTATFPTSSIAAERLCRTGPCYCPTPSPTASPRSDRCRSMICSPAWNRDRPRHLSVPAHLRSLTEVHMADNKTKTDGRDRSRVSGSEPYEVEYFAQKHGLNAQQARDLIAQVGNDSEKLDAAAEKLTGRRGQN